MGCAFHHTPGNSARPRAAVAVSAAPLLAGAAGACAAGGLGELAVLASGRGRRRGVLARGVRRLGRALGARAPRGLAARMAAAGVDAPLGDVVALKAGLALLAALLALPAALGAPGRLGVAVVMAAPAAGFFAPDAW